MHKIRKEQLLDIYNPPEHFKPSKKIMVLLILIVKN